MYKIQRNDSVFPFSSFRFHEWPETALVSVAKRFISDVEGLPSDYQDSVAQFMAFVHSSVNEMSTQYLSVIKFRFSFSFTRFFNVSI